MNSQDQLYRFVFESLDIRGEIVQMDASWKAVLERYTYPATVAEQLGQAMAAVILLSATIKYDGSLILQSQGNGPLRTLVAQATRQRTVRVLARWEGELPEGNLAKLYGTGQMMLTVVNRGGERYQGIVGLEGENLAEALEGYFNNSEQLATRFWLVADGERAAGLFLQQLPSELDRQAEWQRIGMLAETITRDELLNLPVQTLLHRLFHEEQVRLFEPEPVAFRCSCSRERIADSLRAMGKAELLSILEEQGAIEVDCDFCNKHYRFDAIDTEQLFIDGVPIDTSDTPQ
ncbi:Hsp33 family molecular chaperone HslO [Sedimenticola selenatireducens]|uniref:33 kDa chaperonin n=1 Tax=Sedimenticola selenatireducens TaxID=191960 RepID=A0A2N6CU03_9GAMM|nr:Hsp33 family molecular chaperone HslO [Sedimenticola selenatireducens]PLX60608.1 MAG: Hsp33 family molecular chaperone HslO [Sedimenticola selenatireducens]